MTEKNSIKKLTLAALFLAISYVLPFLTGQIPEVGSMLCPMHLPTLLCGFILGGRYGAAIGFTAPLFRSLTLGMPPLFPTAVCMSLELCAYGAVAGLMHVIFKRRRAFIYLSLVTAMIVGRIVYGLSMLICLGLLGEGDTMSAFIAATVSGALPGILLQLVVIPPAVMLLENPRILRLNE